MRPGIKGEQELYQPDLQLQCPNGLLLSVHKGLLASASPRLNAVLSGDFTARVLPVLGVDSHALEAVVGSFYTGSCDITASNVAAIYDAAMKLEVQSVTEACNAFMQHSLTWDNCCTVMQGSLQHATPAVLQQCLVLLDSKFDNVVSSADFLSSSYDVVKVLLSSLPKQPRAAVLQAATAWLQHDPARSKQQGQLLEALGLPHEPSGGPPQPQQQHSTAPLQRTAHDDSAMQLPMLSQQQPAELSAAQHASTAVPSAAVSSATVTGTLMSLLKHEDDEGAPGVSSVGDPPPPGGTSGRENGGLCNGRSPTVSSVSDLHVQLQQQADLAAASSGAVGVQSGGVNHSTGAGLRPEDPAAVEAVAGHRGTGQVNGDPCGCAGSSPRGAGVDDVGRMHRGKRQREDEGPMQGEDQPDTAPGLAPSHMSGLLSLLMQQQQQPQQQQQQQQALLPLASSATPDGAASRELMHQVLNVGGLEALRQLLSLASPSLEQQQASALLAAGRPPEPLEVDCSTLLLQGLRRQQEQQQQQVLLQGVMGQGQHVGGPDVGAGLFCGSGDLSGLELHSSASALLMGMPSTSQLLQAPYGDMGVVGGDGGCGLKAAGGGQQQQQQQQRGARASLGSKGTCHVDNCNADLTGLREYHVRYKICEYHLKAPSILKDGMAQRFCQQCGRFHTLDAFDGTRRSCRTMLQRHNARRAKKSMDPQDPMAGASGRNPLAAAAASADAASLAALTSMLASGEENFLREVHGIACQEVPAWRIS